jgi:hypothetical protein
MDFIPWTSFDRLVAKYGGDVRMRKFRPCVKSVERAKRRRDHATCASCTEQFRAMAFAQMTYRESLRDIEACLNAQPRPSSTAWVFAIRSQSLLWPMRTNSASPNFSIAPQKNLAGESQSDVGCSRVLTGSAAAPISK